MMNLPSLDFAAATCLAEITLGHVTREYPHKVDHVMDSEADVYTPRALHPLFFGSFDWHSCVHGYWLLARVRRLYPELPQTSAISGLFHAQFDKHKVEAERNYFARPSSRGFEQPYGWAWFLMLSAELHRNERSDGRRWLEVLAPLRTLLRERLAAYLIRLTYPIRGGAHTNTAFALVLAAEYAEIFADAELQHLLKERAIHWFGADKNAPAWEPGGDDFLSPTLLEAEAMRRLAPPETFQPWLRTFLPELACGKPEALFTPAAVSDRMDGKIGHLDGLNLSRAWCLRLLSLALPEGSSGEAFLLATAHAHFEAARPQLTANYLSEHWLASFALLALSVPDYEKTQHPVRDR